MHVADAAHADVHSAQLVQWGDASASWLSAPGVIFGYERNTTTTNIPTQEWHRDRDHYWQ
jgi:hypothetical protein